MAELSGLDPEEDLGNLLSIPSSVNGLEEKNELQLAIPASEDHCIMDVNIDSDSSESADGWQECHGDPAEIQECLSANQSLQKQLCNVLSHIQSSLDKNIAEQAQLSEEIADDNKTSKSEPNLTDYRSFRLFTCPYFRDAREMFPPNNEDTIVKTNNHDFNAYIRPSKPWSDEEKTQLHDGVLANALEVVLKNKEFRRDYLRSKLSGCYLLGEKNKYRREIKSLNQTIADIKKKSPEYILKEADGKIDWLKVSATYLKGSRDDNECEFMWNNYVSIFLNQNDFNEEEDAKLKEIVKYRRGMQDWDTIAELLGTQRSAIQCMERYQRELNINYYRPFTHKEDEHILKFVESKRIGDYIPWNQLCIKDKSNPQVSARFRLIKKSYYKGPFTKYEDAMLLACFAKYGPRWSEMEKNFFPNRSQNQLHLRQSMLDPSLKYGPWTKEEDQQLAELIVRYGYCWAKIATKIPGRHFKSVFSRTKYLVKSIKKCDKSLRNVNYREDTGFLLKHLPDWRPGKPWLVNPSGTYKPLYDAVLETLRKALCNISFPLAEDVQVDKINLPFLHLVKLHEELKGMEEEERTETERIWHPHIDMGKIPSWKIFDLPSDNKCSPVVTSESEMEVEPESTPEVPQLVVEEPVEPEVGLVVEEPVEPEVDGAWVNQVLEAKFQEECITYDLRPMLKCWIHGSLRKGKNLYFLFYQEYLRKELFLPPSIDLKRWGTIRKLTEYNRSVNTVISQFIQPKPREHEVILLSPNHATLLGLDVMLAALPRLQRTAQFVDRSTPYMEYLNGSKVQDFCCFACSSKNENSQEAYQNTIKDMESELLIVDEAFDENAKCEAGYLQEQNDVCMCNALLESKAQVDLLMKRFVALFYWPYFLSSVTSQANKKELIEIVRTDCVEKKKLRDEKRRRKKDFRTYWSMDQLGKAYETDRYVPRKKRPRLCQLKRDFSLREESD